MGGACRVASRPQGLGGQGSTLEMNCGAHDSHDANQGWKKPTEGLPGGPVAQSPVPGQVRNARMALTTR